MSTDTPVILVAVGTGTRDFWDEEPIRHVNQRTDIPLVLLIDHATLGPENIVGLENVEWHSIIRNTGDKHPADFRQRAYEIIRDHSTMVPVAVVDLDPRFDKMWDIPVMKHWSRL